MANIKYNISFDIGSVLDITAIVNKQIFPLLNQAVRAVAQQTASDWQAEVYKAKLWSGEKDAYAQSIKWEMTGDFTAVVEATYKHAGEIETGRPARDLKKMLGTSTKVRRTEKGKRFLVIPMRQNVEKLEQAGLYEAAAGLSASSVTGKSRRIAGEITHLSPSSGMSPAKKQTQFLTNRRTKQAQQVRQNTYAWGQRISAAQAGSNKWAAGLVRFDTSTPKAKSSSYMTFRIMMEGSGGWIVPAQPGMYLAKKVTDNMQPLAQAAFSEAIKRQLKG